MISLSILNLELCKRSVNLEKKLNSRFSQKTNETREKIILIALRIVFIFFKSFVRFLEELIISEIAFEIYWPLSNDLNNLLSEWGKEYEYSKRLDPNFR